MGADGAAVITRQITLPRPGVIRAIAIDYANQPATTDVVIKANSSTGTTLFTASNTATDIPGSPVGTTAIDETNSITAATDGMDGGWFYTTGLNIDVAQADGQTSGGARILIDLWIDD